MHVSRSFLPWVVVALGASCTEAPDPVTPEAVDLEIVADWGTGEYKAQGSGTYVIPLSDGTGIESRFSFVARQVDADGEAQGRFRHRLMFGGELIDFVGRVTCLTVDRAEGRAWIGGVVQRNRSVAEPYASGEIFQPGKDIWFRVLDLGPNRLHLDRTTFVGFEGGGGVITSQEYCDTRPWPDDNARTNEIVKGGVKLAGPE